jgi:D-alanyl-D-alanine carboxypeptidase (penicillin-binding protein 5/6)
MKKLLAFFMTFNILILSVFCLPFNALADEKKSTDGLYTVSETVYADAYMLINLDDSSYPVIASKNAEKKKYPASLTKIVTAMVTINNVPDLSVKTTVSKNAVEILYGTGAQVAGLSIGDEITIEQLLYLTMVHSACDACEVLAEYVGGSVEGFVQMMNDWVKSLGCENTNFVNPDGLHDENHYTTAADMATITLEAIKNDNFNKISSTQTYEYDGTTFVHTNYMLDKYHVSYYYEYAQGIKTGSTDEAGYCVITKASKNGYNYLAIVMDSPIKKLKGYDTKCSFIDAATLFDWAFDGLKYSTVIRKNDVVSEIPVINGKDADTVQLVAEKDITTLVPTSLDPSAVIIEPVDQPESVEAPVTQGDKICSANIIYADQTIATVDLVAAKTIELSTFLKILNVLKDFFKSKIVIAIIVIIILLAVAYLVVFANRIRQNKKRINEKRRKQQELDNQMNGYLDGSDDDFIPPPRRKR